MRWCPKQRTGSEPTPCLSEHHLHRERKRSGEPALFGFESKVLFEVQTLTSFRLTTRRQTGKAIASMTTHKAMTEERTRHPSQRCSQRRWHRDGRVKKMMQPKQIIDAGESMHIAQSPNRCCSSGDVLQWRGSLHPRPSRSPRATQRAWA